MKQEEFIKRIKNTTFILVDSYINASTSVKFKCKKCKYIKLIRPNHILNGSGCSNCSGVRKKTHDEYIQDLSLVNPDIIVMEKYKSAAKKILHKCLKCENESSYIPNNLLRGQGCKKCANNQNIGTNGYKDKLKTSNKKIICIDNYINRNFKINHLCLICNKTFLSSPCNVLVSKNLGCPSCKISIGEEKIKNYLDLNKISYIQQFKHKDCKNKKELPFDFYLPDYNLCIEYDGRQHFESVSVFGGEDGFNKLKINDSIKNNWCLNNNIILIRIAYFDINNIKSILDSLIIN